MRSRLRKYMSVVMTLLLCLGLWFQHGQAVQAAGEQTATVMIDYGTGTAELGEVTINNFEYAPETDSCQGTITLTETQTKGTDGYFIYWYAESGRVNSAATGSTPTIDISTLETGMVSCITNEDGSYTVMIVLYAGYGASHKISYYMNESMDGVTNGTLDQEKVYYQKDTSETGGTYEHPSEPGQANGDKFFIGWSSAHSGEVVAPASTFTYGDADVNVYAIWQTPYVLMVNYYATQEDIATQTTCYNAATNAQESLTDTTFSFTTPAAPARDNYFFEAWSYDDGTGTVKTVAENTAVDIAIPSSGSDVALDLYGTWTAAESLTVTYVSEGTTVGNPETIYQNSADDTTFSFTTAAEPTAPSDNYIFEGWSYTNFSGATVTIGAGETCSDISISTDEVTMTAAWTETTAAGSTIGAGTYTLQAGTAYTLGSGSWTVTYNGSGDSCTYAGGRTFYVTTTGDYTFASN
ncbi:MAG: hypothetical protein IJZ23_10825 [Roseburia sp.]|nr:hypothetical protein [Roseburia sp.]